MNGSFGNFVVKTDQSVAEGGEGAEPSPFQLFLASLATCAGIFTLRFCQARNLPIDQIKIKQTTDWNHEKKLVENLVIQIDLPHDFPEKYVDALVRSVDQCTVKRSIANPPKMEVRTKIASA